MIIDAHTHFYDPTRPEGVPWPKPDSSLYRPVLPEHFRAVAGPCGVTHTVVVEASPWVDDNDWLLTLSSQTPEVLGVIGRLDPLGDDFGTHLDRLAAQSLFRGVRMTAKDLDAALDQPRGRDAVAELSRRGLTLDLQCGPVWVGTLRRLVGLVPDMSVVVNHLATCPDASGGLDDAWRDFVHALAPWPRVYGKVSGFDLKARSIHERVPDDPSVYRTGLDALGEALGPGRVLFASNWPVSERDLSYAAVVNIIDTWLEQFPQSDRAAVWSGNARAAYGLAAPQGTPVISTPGNSAAGGTTR